MEGKMRKIVVLYVAIIYVLVLQHVCTAIAVDENLDDEDLDKWLNMDSAEWNSNNNGNDVPEPEEDADPCANPLKLAAEGKKCCPFPSLLPRYLLVETRPKKGGAMYEPGEEVQFKCSQGYVISYEDAVICQPDGSWSGYLPMCIRNWAEPRIVQAEKVKPEKLELSCMSGNLNIPADAIKQTECHKNDGTDLMAQLWALKTKEGKYSTRAKKPWTPQNVRGDYTCYCRLRNNTVWRLTSSLFQESKMKFTQLPHNFTLLTLGQDRLLQCSAGDAIITWMKEDQVLYYDTHHYAQLPNGDLLVMDIQMDQVGEYTCVAEHPKTRQKIRHSAYIDVEAPAKEVCGRPSLKKMKRERMAGGVIAPRASHPWIAYLDIRRGGKVFMCGGSLVDYTYVVTAAHCIYNERTGEEFDVSEVTVVLGKHQRKGIHPDELRFEVESVDPHPFYDAVTKDFDIAVLTLKDKVRFTDAIRPICLPGRGFLDEFYRAIANKERVYGVVAGWGRQSNDVYSAKDLYPEELMQVRVPLVPQKVCLAYAATEKVEHISDNMFCAGADGMDACEGDSGGPFEIKKDDKVYLAGLVSFGIGEDCGAPGTYGFYTKMELFVDEQGDLDMCAINGC